MTHYTHKKTVRSDKLDQWVKAFSVLKKKCVKELKSLTDTKQKTDCVLAMIKAMEKHLMGKHKSRVRWYSLVEDAGQWKKMDAYMHGLIRASFRQAGVPQPDGLMLPSVHAQVHAIKLKGVVRNAG
jgi:hypothetical protein